MLVWPLFYAPLIGALSAALLGARRFAVLAACAGAVSICLIQYFQMQKVRLATELLLHPPPGVTVTLGAPFPLWRHVASSIGTTVAVIGAALVAAGIVKLGIAAIGRFHVSRGGRSLSQWAAIETNTEAGRERRPISLTTQEISVRRKRRGSRWASLSALRRSDGHGRLDVAVEGANILELRGHRSIRISGDFVGVLVPNIVLAEWFVRRTQAPSPAVGGDTFAMGKALVEGL